MCDVNPFLKTLWNLFTVTWRWSSFLKCKMFNSSTWRVLEFSCTDLMLIENYCDFPILHPLPPIPPSTNIIGFLCLSQQSLNFWMKLTVTHGIIMLHKFADGSGYSVYTFSQQFLLCGTLSSMQSCWSLWYFLLVSECIWTYCIGKLCM